MNIFKALWRIVRHPRNIYSLFHAAAVYNRGKHEALEKFRRTGRRYYLIYDPNDRSLVPLTYEFHKGHADSYQYLRRRGRIAPITLQKFKEGAFYYTASKNGAQEMPVSVQQQKLDILRFKSQYEVMVRNDDKIHFAPTCNKLQVPTSPAPTRNKLQVPTSSAPTCNKLQVPTSSTAPTRNKLQVPTSPAPTCNKLQVPTSPAPTCNKLQVPTKHRNK